MKRHQIKLLYLSSLGGILEFFDFIIYGLFASYIANAFFPETNSLLSLIITFATFAIGYLVRPLGGIIFGHFGDKVGRKAIFTISILMMAISTIGIGLIPPYSMIGIWAPILVTLLRITQGLSVGGEIPGAITYVSESLPNRKGLACGIIFSSLTFGVVLGFLVQASLISLYNDAQMQSFGWRIPFILGGIFGLFSYLLRRGLHESTEFKKIETFVEKYPFITVIKEKSAHAIAGVFIVAICAAIISGLYLFTPAYFTKVLNLPANTYIWERTGTMALASFLSLPFGYLTDIFNIKMLIKILVVLTLFMAYPIFAIYAYYPDYYILALLMSALLTGYAAGVIPPLLVDLFPTKIRYSGVAVSYNLGFAIFGGLTPFFSLSLIYLTGLVTMPSGYLIIVALLTSLALYFIPNKNVSFLKQT